MGSVGSDIRFILRSLRKTPLFVVVALTSLALGIGANTAIFSLMDQVMLRSLPVKEPQQLVTLQWKGAFSGSQYTDHGPFSYPAYKEFRDRSSSIFKGVLADYQVSVDLGWKGVAERAQASLVSGNYFEVLGVETALGRPIRPTDDAVKNAGPYMVLSHTYWKRRFGGDPAVVNRIIDLNGHPMTIVGVAQPGFKGTDVGSPADIFVPLVMKEQVTPSWDMSDDRSAIWLHLFARLRPGISRKEAEGFATSIYRQVQREDLKNNAEVTADFRTRYLKNPFALEDAGRGLSSLRDQFSKPLIVLMSMVGTLLLIACGNVANMLVARATARQREIAIRLSVGATKASLIRLVLMESLLLSLAGAAAGLLIASWSASLLLRALPFENAPETFSTAPDGRILLFTLGVAILTTLVFGAIPAIQCLRPDLAPVLKNEAGSVIGGTHAFLRKGVAAAQISLSLLLLIGTVLFARSLQNVMASQTGMNTKDILSFSIDPSLANYPDERIRRSFVTLKSSLSSLPGVEEASGSGNPILAEARWMSSVRAEGHAGAERQAGREAPNPITNSVLPGFFRTLGIRQLAGRDFTERDSLKTSKVAIVNQEFARVFFDGKNPVGRRIGFGNARTAVLDTEVIGLVSDSKGLDLREKPTPYVYIPTLQFERVDSVTLYLRAAGDPKSLAEAATRVVRKLDPAVPIYGMKTLDVQADETHYVERLTFALSAASGVLATLLAAFGLYGVMAFTVARRTREIGIRMALGAQSGAVLGMVMREVVLVTAVGIGLALPVALVLGRLVESQLFQVKASDPASLIGATGLLVVVALAAGYIPARYAARIDPLIALRWD